MISQTSGTVYSFPVSKRASAGQTETHAPQRAHRLRFRWCAGVKLCAPAGHDRMHSPQPMQSSGIYSKSVPKRTDSGLWHHRQRRLQPLKKTVLRIPGPSWDEQRWISNKTPVKAVVSILSHSFTYNIKMAENTSIFRSAGKNEL